MLKLEDPRIAYAEITADGVDISRAINESLESLVYTDANGEANELKITLDDVDGKWSGPWRIKAGMKLSLTIVTESWEKPGTIDRLPCGTFTVTGAKREKPPSIITVEAISLPVNSPVRREIHSRGWEDTTLSQVASDVAASGGLTSMFLFPSDHNLDRVDQRQESDLAFFTRLAADFGASVKVTGNLLVTYDEAEFEGKDPTLTVKDGVNMLSASFWQDTSDTAKSATVSYKDPHSGKLVSETFKPEFADIMVGNDLVLNERPYNVSKKPLRGH